MRVISQDGSIDVDYRDIGFLINGTQIIGIFPRTSVDNRLIAEYETERDAILEIDRLHSTYVKLRENPGCYRFSDKEVYRKPRKKGSDA